MIGTDVHFSETIVFCLSKVSISSIEQLRRLIDQCIDEWLTALLGKFEIDEEELFADEEPDTRTWEEVKQDIERDRWTPPPGAKLSLDLLREDRDS